MGQLDKEICNLIESPSGQLTYSPEQHLEWQHEGADGWLAICKKINGNFYQHFYKPSQLTTENLSGIDCYWSENTFYRPKRRVEDIRQLRSLYVDVDFYKKGYPEFWVIGHVSQKIEDGVLPLPTLAVSSGRGVQLIWSIKPVPYQALPLWQAVENKLFEELESVGADPAARDASRVLRIAGTVNSKNGEQVKAILISPDKYELRKLQKDFLPKLETKPRKRHGRPNKVQYLYNSYSLNKARLDDLVLLVHLRHGQMTGKREITLFLYRYWGCCFLNDTIDALRQTMEFNEEFTEPLPENEVVNQTESAEKAYLSRDKAYRYKNTTLIRLLEINESEQQKMTTIIGGNEKRRRLMAQRRSKGVLTRQEYLQGEADKTADKLFLLRQALKKHPKATQIELADLLKVSQPHVHRLLRKLR